VIGSLVAGAFVIAGVVLKWLLNRSRRKAEPGDVAAVSVGGNLTVSGIANIGSGHQNVTLHVHATADAAAVVLARLRSNAGVSERDVASIEENVREALDAARASAGEGAVNRLREGDFETLLGVLRTELDTARRAGKGHVRDAALAARRLGLVALVGSRTEALRAFSEAVTLNPDDADAWNWLGVIQLKAGDVDAARRALRRAEEIFRTNANLVAAAEVLTNIGVVEEVAGDLAESTAIQARALALNQAGRNDRGVAANLSNLALLAWKRGRLDEAENHFNRAVEIETRRENFAGLASDLGNLGVLSLTRAGSGPNASAHLDAAESYLQRAYAADERLDNGRGMAEQLGNLGLVRSRRADFAERGSPGRARLLEEARSFVSRALGIATQVGAKDVEANQYSNLGVICEDEGDLAGAVGYWGQARDTYNRLGMETDARKMTSWIQAAGG